MYTYEYERIYSKSGFLTAETTDYQAFIAARAENGWRYVGFLPARQSGNGIISEMDLVFEKER